MDRIKVLHVYKSFNIYNGLIEILNILAQNFDHQRYELGVCVNEYTNNDFGARFEELGGKIFNLDTKPRVGKKQNELLALHRFFKQYKPDIVQTHVLKANLYGTLAAKMAGVPVVITTEMTLKDTAPTVFGRFRDKLVQPLTGFMIKWSDKFMVTSEFIKGQWQSRDDNNHVEVIYPPFNLEKYDRAVRTPRLNTEFIGKRVGFVGRLSDEKAIDKLLLALVEVIKTVPDVKCTIVGTGPLENQLKDMCNSLQLQNCVDFIGYKENSFEALREIDIFVLPSRTEGCPIVILEAMAMGLPVVATNVGGNPELVVDNETGILVSQGDPMQIAGAIIALLTNREKSLQMGQNGRRRAFSQFHPSSFTSKLQMLYQDLYNKHSQKQ